MRAIALHVCPPLGTGTHVAWVVSDVGRPKLVERLDLMLPMYRHRLRLSELAGSGHVPMFDNPARVSDLTLWR